MKLRVQHSNSRKSRPHKLKDGTLTVQRNGHGETEGIVGTCVCGWTTGPRFSMGAASAMFQNHVEDEASSHE